MKPLRLLSFALLIGVNVTAQEFSIPWFQLGGSARNSSGGSFSLAGNVGNPSAGSTGTPISGGGFGLSPATLGFAMVIVNPEAPKLRVQSGPGGIVLAWPHASNGFVLQLCTNLASPVWTTVQADAFVVGDEKHVSFPFEPGHRFFRLHRP